MADQLETASQRGSLKRKKEKPLAMLLDLPLAWMNFLSDVSMAGTRSSR